MEKKPNGARDPGRTREALIEAAEKIIVEKGLQATTIEEVAAAASISKGGLLHHFPSKNALIQGIAEDMVHRYGLDIEEYRRQDPAAPGAFTRAFLRANLQCKEECSQLCNALASDMRTLPGVLEVFRQHSQQCQQRIEDDGIDPITASIVRYAGEGLMSAAVWGMPRPAHYDEIVEELLQMAGGAREEVRRNP